MRLNIFITVLEVQSIQDVALECPGVRENKGLLFLMSPCTVYTTPSPSLSDILTEKDIDTFFDNCLVCDFKRCKLWIFGVSRDPLGIHSLYFIPPYVQMKLVGQCHTVQLFYAIRYKEDNTKIVLTYRDVNLVPWDKPNKVHSGK